MYRHHFWDDIWIWIWWENIRGNLRLWFWLYKYIILIIILYLSCCCLLLWWCKALVEKYNIRSCDKFSNSNFPYYRVLVYPTRWTFHGHIITIRRHTPDDDKIVTPFADCRHIFPNFSRPIYYVCNIYPA